MINSPNPRLIQILNQYIPAEDGTNGGGEILATTYQNMQNPELLVPILGLQGVGKSTLINGIIGENIMPNEADETTCVPVEIRYGDTSDIILCFSNGDNKTIRQDEIAEYVDNNNNPGNEKGIAKIVILRDLDLLQNGLVLVDLPGVGSLTANNQATTMEYIKRLYSAIFVIRVNPPITRTEANFIKIAWSSLNNAWFVQNRWNDENDRATAEGLEANHNILKDIAENRKIPYKGEVITVNAYKALKGTIEADTKQIQESGIQILVSKLQELAINWRADASIRYKEKATSLVFFARQKIENEIINCQLSKADLEAKLSKEEEDFAANTAQVQRKAQEIFDLINDKTEDIKALIRSIVKECEENIRSNVFRVVDAGITDGEELTQVFDDFRAQEIENAVQQYSDYIWDINNEITEKIAELENIIINESHSIVAAHNFYKEEEFKWEKGADAILKIGGAAVGAWLGFIVITGPIGIVAAVGIGLLGSLLGKKTKELKTASRASETKRLLASVIEEVCKQLKNNLDDSWDSYHRDTQKSLENYCKDRQAYFKNLCDENKKKLLSDVDPREQIRVLQEHLELLSKMEGDFLV